MSPVPSHSLRGYRWLHELVGGSPRAYRFRYYSWAIWIPRSVAVLTDKGWAAPEWAVRTAKEHFSAVQYADAAEAEAALRED